MFLGTGSVSLGKHLSVRKLGALVGSRVGSTVGRLVGLFVGVVGL